MGFSILGTKYLFYKQFFFHENQTAYLSVELNNPLRI